MKVDKNVKKETLNIALGMLIMSALMNVVFLVFGKWRLGVLWSNLLVGTAMVMNFFLMCMTIQKAITCGDEKKARAMATLSQTVRLLALAGIVALGAAFSNVGDYFGKASETTAPFEFLALLPPLFFNRITLMVRSSAIKKEEAKNPPAIEREEQKDPPESEVDEQ